MKPSMQQVWDAFVASPSESTFVRLYEITYEEVRTLCRHRIPQVEGYNEATSHVFARLWSLANTPETTCTLPSNVFQALRQLVNQECDILRKRHMRGTTRCRTDVGDVLYETPAPTTTPRQALHQRDVQNYINRAISQLPQEMAEMVLSYFFVGKSHAELAEELNLCPKTVSRRLDRALERLQSLLPADLSNDTDASL
jgi:RNA polymerase sigma-70 factor, ECF subfamily